MRLSCDPWLRAFKTINIAPMTTNPTIVLVDPFEFFDPNAQYFNVTP